MSWLKNFRSRLAHKRETVESTQSQPELLARLGSFVHSIRFRLVLWFVFILALVLAAFSTFIYVNQAYDLRLATMDYLGRRLGRLQGLMAYGAHQAEMTGSNNAVLLIPQNFLQDSDELIITDPQGTVLASHGPLQDQQAAYVATHSAQSRMAEAAPDYLSWSAPKSAGGGEYLFLAEPLSDDVGFSGFIVLGRPLDADGLLARLGVTLLGGSLLTLLVALLGGLWLADRAMRPVKTITQTARQISESDLSRRLNMRNRDELGELAGTFDAMLARLQAAFERQREFVADASHELRTPLTIVNLETGRALAAPRRPEEYQRALTVIQGENEFMTRLVTDLLALARMDAGQAQVEQEHLDLSDVTLEAVERLTSLAERKGVRLETGELPEVRIRGDRRWLLQMVSNLVENGIKYAGSSDPHVRVETGLADGKGWLHVTDNGPGIPPEHLAHIFERFYRVDKSRARIEGANEPPSGSGLGLSIVHWIVRAHGGSIHVKSTAGEGTRFEMDFPAN